MPIDKPSKLRQRAEQWWDHIQRIDPSAPYGGWYQEMAYLVGYRAALNDMRNKHRIRSNLLPQPAEVGPDSSIQGITSP